MGKKLILCKVCGSNVEKDAIGLYKKIIDKNSKRFLCLNCLANHLDTSVDELEIKIQEFKDEGCKLFE